eukprot:267950-Hanusia_phi.AAC.2
MKLSCTPRRWTSPASAAPFCWSSARALLTTASRPCRRRIGWSRTCAGRSRRELLGKQLGVADLAGGHEDRIEAEGLVVRLVRVAAVAGLAEAHEAVDVVVGAFLADCRFRSLLGNQDRPDDPLVRGDRSDLGLEGRDDSRRTLQLAPVVPDAEVARDRAAELEYQLVLCEPLRELAGARALGDGAESVDGISLVVLAEAAEVASLRRRGAEETSIAVKMRRARGACRNMSLAHMTRVPSPLPRLFLPTWTLKSLRHLICNEVHFWDSTFSGGAEREGDHRKSSCMTLPVQSIHHW